MPAPDKFETLSGLVIEDPLGRLTAFCMEEYDYYDGLPRTDPQAIEPLDVLASVAQ